MAMKDKFYYTQEKCVNLNELHNHIHNQLLQVVQKPQQSHNWEGHMKYM